MDTNEADTVMKLLAMGLKASDILQTPIDLWLTLETEDEKWTFGPGQSKAREVTYYYYEARFKKGGKSKSKKKILRLTKEQYSDKDLLEELKKIYDPPKQILFSQLSEYKGRIIGLKTDIGILKAEIKELKDIHGSIHKTKAPRTLNSFMEEQPEMDKLKQDGK